MSCCDNKPVIILPGGEKLCKSHFIKYFESKIAKTISRFDLIKDNDHIGVAVSGGKDSLTVLRAIKRLSDRNPTLTVSALAIDEGIHGYRDKTLVTAQEACDKLGITLHITSYKDAFGMPLDDILQNIKVKPCTVCGIFRRYLLNRKAKELGFTKLATGHNLDDEAQSILMNQFRNDVKASARLGPRTGVKDQKGFIPRIKPLYLCTEKEVTTYAFLKGILDTFTECPNASQAYRAEVRETLNQMELKYPGTKYSLINSFLETLPMLREKYKSGSVSECPRCGEPSASPEKLCNACKWAAKVQNLLEREHS